MKIRACESKVIVTDDIWNINKSCITTFLMYFWFQKTLLVDLIIYFFCNLAACTFKNPIREELEMDIFKKKINA